MKRFILKRVLYLITLIESYIYKDVTSSKSILENYEDEKLDEEVERVVSTCYLIGEGRFKRLFIKKLTAINIIIAERKGFTLFDIIKKRGIEKKSINTWWIIKDKDIEDQLYLYENIKRV